MTIAVFAVLKILIYLILNNVFLHFTLILISFLQFCAENEKANKGAGKGHHAGQTNDAKKEARRRRRQRRMRRNRRNRRM